MINIALVEDDDDCVEATQNYIKKFCEQTNAQAQLKRFKDGLDFLNDYKPIYDVIFMDIEMPYLNGIDVARKLRKIDSTVAIIFMTNMAQYAIKGYEVEAIDYIVKPVSYFTFVSKLNKAMKFNERYSDVDLVISPKTGKVCLQSSSVYYVEIINHRLIFHTKNGEYEVSGSLSKIEEELSSVYFARCNSCYLVNLRFVTGVSGDMVTVAEDDLKISRPKRKEFMRSLTSYRGGIR